MSSKSIILKTFKKIKTINPEKGVSFAKDSNKKAPAISMSRRARGVLTSKELLTISKLKIDEGYDDEEKEDQDSKAKENVNESSGNGNNSKSNSTLRRMKNQSSKTINTITEMVLFNKITLANCSDFFYSESSDLFHPNEKVYIGLSYNANPAMSIANFAFNDNSHDIDIDDTSNNVCKAISIDNFEGKNTEGLFCLFEGHSGPEIAIYLQKNFRHTFLKSKQLTSDTDNAIKIAFCSIDKEMEQKSFTSGSTGNIIYIRRENNKQVLYSANAGNCKTYLITFDEAKEISFEHIVTNAKENKRLVSNGAMIINDRLMGNFSLSRSFGDYKLKAFGVQSEPNVTRHVIEDKDIYVIVGNSAMWSLLTKSDIYKLALCHQSSSSVMKNITHCPMIYNSKEHIACFVLQLK